MKIKEITFEQVIQVRQYEPCRVSATAVINEGENPIEAMAQLKALVQEELKKAYLAGQKKAPAPKASAPTDPELYR